MQGQQRGCRAPCAIGMHHSCAHSEKKAKCVLLCEMGVQHSPGWSLCACSRWPSPFATHAQSGGSYSLLLELAFPVLNLLPSHNYTASSIAVKPAPSFWNMGCLQAAPALLSSSRAHRSCSHQLCSTAQHRAESKPQPQLIGLTGGGKHQRRFAATDRCHCI